VGSVRLTLQMGKNQCQFGVLTISFYHLLQQLTMYVSQIANLTVNKSGSGNITSNPAGISCGSTCTASFNSGQFVTLTASPDNGFIFSNWTGACAGSANCTVTMNSEKTVGATFTASSSNRTLTVTKSGSGTITSVPATISCGATCSGTFTSGTTVSLFAQPDYGFAFAGWGGPCASTGTCVVTMDGDKSVSANFIELPKYPVKAIKPSTGVISSEPAGILCGGSNRQCSSMFSSAKLSATPNPGYEFIRWNGCQAPEGNICYIKPIGKMTVSAVLQEAAEVQDQDQQKHSGFDHEHTCRIELPG